MSSRLLLSTLRLAALVLLAGSGLLLKRHLEHFKDWRRCEEDFDGLTLIRAAGGGKLGRVKALLSRGVDVNYRSITGKLTALEAAIYYEHVDVVREIVAVAALNVNARAADDKSMLLLAVELGHLEIVRLLLDAQYVRLVVEPDVLITAVRLNRGDVVRLLMSRSDIDVNAAVTPHGAAPLIIAAALGRTDIVAELLKRPDIQLEIEYSPIP
jgi:ankyrin repeat protein